MIENILIFFFCVWSEVEKLRDKKKKEKEFI